MTIGSIVVEPVVAASLISKFTPTDPGQARYRSGSGLVVDNASTDASAAVVSAHPGVRLERNEENLGYARAMNLALTGSSARSSSPSTPTPSPPARFR